MSLPSQLIRLIFDTNCVPIDTGALPQAKSQKLTRLPWTALRMRKEKFQTKKKKKKEKNPKWIADNLTLSVNPPDFQAKRLIRYPVVAASMSYARIKLCCWSFFF